MASTRFYMHLDVWWCLTWAIRSWCDVVTVWWCWFFFFSTAHTDIRLLFCFVVVGMFVCLIRWPTRWPRDRVLTQPACIPVVTIICFLIFWWLLKYDISIFPVWYKWLFSGDDKYYFFFFFVWRRPDPMAQFGDKGIIEPPVTFGDIRVDLRCCWRAARTRRQLFWWPLIFRGGRGSNDWRDNGSGVATQLTAALFIPVFGFLGIQAGVWHYCFVFDILFYSNKQWHY